jgi:hypothetical protein
MVERRPLLGSVYPSGIPSRLAKGVKMARGAI